MHTETITWYTPAERLPDSDTTVLLRMPEGWDEPVWPGFHNGEVWCDESGIVVDEPLRWAEIPTGDPAGVEGLDERQRFEAWLRRRWPNAARPIDEKTPTGHYVFTENNILWEAWQEAAPGVPVSAIPQEVKARMVQQILNPDGVAVPRGGEQE